MLPHLAITFHHPRYLFIIISFTPLFPSQDPKDLSISLNTVTDTEFRLSLYIPDPHSLTKHHSSYTFTPSCSFLTVSKVTQYRVECHIENHLIMCAK